MSNAGTQSRSEQLWTECLHLLDEGYSPRRVVQMLVHQNWSEGDALQFVTTAQAYLHQERGTPAGVAKQQRRAWGQLQYAAVWIIGGVLVAGMMKYWPRSEILGVISFVLLAYGLLEGFSGFRAWMRCRSR